MREGTEEIKKSAYKVFAETMFSIGDKILSTDFTSRLDQHRAYSSLGHSDLQKLQLEKLAAILDFASTKSPYYKNLNLSADSDPEAWPVLLDHNGNIAEGVGGNFFLVTDGVIRTPTDGAVLQGISRQTVLELARTLGIPVIEEDLQPYDAYNADEVFISGTSHSMIPVSKVDFRPLKQSVPGPIFQQLMAAWDELVGLDIVEQARNMAKSLPE